MQGSSTHTMATKPNNLVTHDWVRTRNRRKLGARAVTMPMASPILSASRPQPNLTPVSISPLWATAGSRPIVCIGPLCNRRASGNVQRVENKGPIASSRSPGKQTTTALWLRPHSRVTDPGCPGWTLRHGLRSSATSLDYSDDRPPTCCTVYAKLWWLLVCVHVA
jgi:hypothetical protein